MNLLTAHLLFLIVTFIVHLVSSRHISSQCTKNQLCLKVYDCPRYRAYKDQPFESWPQDIQQNVASVQCDSEHLENTTLPYVCCRTALNDKRCGLLDSNRIAHGTVAQAFDFPWMVLLKIRSGKWHCGGSLLTANYVLTAAHCAMLDKTLIARLGEIDLDSPLDCLKSDDLEDCAPAPQDIVVKDQIEHPEYSPRNRRNDIALMKLQEPAELGRSVRPICLPHGTPAERMLQPSFLIISGWGMTEMSVTSEKLLYAKVGQVSLKECTSRLNLGSIKLDESQVCAGGASDRVDACLSDSGGPLQYITNDTSRFVQYGLVHFGLQTCGVESKPGVYTKVMHYLDWIVQHVHE